MKKETVFVLKSVNADLTAYNNFQWKESGIVTCEDWNPEPECGNGLHGFLWGEGNGYLANWDKDAKWLVLEVEKDSIVKLDGKVKFPSCEVIFCGTRKDATDFIISKGAKGNVIGAYVISGDNGTSTSGYKGTSTSGFNGTSTCGDRGTSTSGDFGTSTSGFKGTSTSGHYGTSTSGDVGTSTSGDKGTSTSGHYGTSTSGDKGTLIIKYWDKINKRSKVATAYVGEDGIEPNVPYKLDENNKFVKA